LNWTFDIFAEFPTFVFSKTFSCHFRSHVLADSATEKHGANYTGYFVGKNFPIYIHLGHLPTVLARAGSCLEQGLGHIGQILSPQKGGSRAFLRTFARAVLFAD
jgi:hypothetical protein